MKIDFNYQFTTLGGEVIPEKPDEETTDKDGKKTTKKHPPWTLRHISENVLLLPDMDKDGNPKEMTGDEKCKRYDLAMRIHKATAKDMADLQAEEIALLKKLIDRNYSTLIVGQAFKILDPHGAVKREAAPQEESKPQGTSEEKTEKDN